MTRLSLIDPTLQAYTVGESTVFYAAPLADARWRLGGQLAAAAGPEERTVVYHRGIVAAGIRGWTGIHDPTGRIPSAHDPNGPLPPDPAVVADLVQRLGSHATALAERIVALLEADEGVLGNSGSGSSSGGTTPG